MSRMNRWAALIVLITFPRKTGSMSCALIDPLQGHACRNPTWSLWRPPSSQTLQQRSCTNVHAGRVVEQLPLHRRHNLVLDQLLALGACEALDIVRSTRACRMKSHCRPTKHNER